MVNRTEYNETSVLANLRLGSEQAFEEIFKRYWKQLYNLARSKVQSHEEAEEIVQVIFSTLWEKREKLLITNLPFYLQAAVRNAVINNLRSKITEKKYWDYYRKFVPQNKHVTEDIVAFNHLNEKVEEAVNRLPEKSRQVFRLSRLEGRSTGEIANLLKLSEKAIEYHITKSLKALRVHLKDFILIIVWLIIFYSHQ